MDKNTKCSKSVYSSDAWHSHQCNFKAKVLRDGKPFCNVHDPIKVKEKYDKQHEEWDRESFIRQEAWRRKRAEANYCEHLSTEYLETHQANPK